MLQAWQPNTLPMPFPILNEAVTATVDAVSSEQRSAKPVLPAVVIDINDNFPKGIINKYFPHQGYGFITTQNGRQVYFSLNELDFSGSKGKESVVVGAPVGYDISHTSHGMHVKKMKLY